MLRVYLDQNKWIDIARAAHGRSGGEPFRDVLEVARYGVEHGLASFPLSSVHYMETYRRRDAASRIRLGRVMAELSRFHTVAPADEVITAELDQALHERYGKPMFPKSLRVFGIGIGHAFARSDFTFEIPDDLDVTEYRRRQLKELGTFILQHGMITGPSEGMQVPGMEENDGYRVYGRQYVQAEKKLAQGFREYDPRRQHIADWVAASALVDNLESLNAAFARARIRPYEAQELDSAEGLTELLLALPSRAVDYELRRLRHQDQNTRWKPNDLEDMAALSIAIPYCDVVVTEAQWCHMVKRANLDQRYGTTVLSDLKDLSAVLVS